MPYKVKFEPNVEPKLRPWKIHNLAKKKVVGSSKTKRDAEASIRARYIGESRKKG